MTSPNETYAFSNDQTKRQKGQKTKGTEEVKRTLFNFLRPGFRVIDYILDPLNAGWGGDEGAVSWKRQWRIQL